MHHWVLNDECGWEHVQYEDEAIKDALTRDEAAAAGTNSDHNFDQDNTRADTEVTTIWSHIDICNLSTCALYQ